MTPTQIRDVLSSHAQWLADAGGARADLTNADLTGADLTGADLASANLARANLARADLTGADLTCADLDSVNLAGADLAGADLRGAILTRADLTNAILTCADLTRADLTRATSGKGTHVAHAAVSASTHGECGRQILAIRWTGGTDYWCGCFRGDEEALRAYIESGREEHRKSRLAALRAVNSMLDLAEGTP